MLDTRRDPRRRGGQHDDHVPRIGGATRVLATAPRAPVSDAPVPGRATGVPELPFARCAQIREDEGQRVIDALESAPGGDVSAETPPPEVAEKHAASPAVPSSAYATSHGKEMRNYRFKAGTTITNTTDLDFGAPNTDHREKVKGRYRARILKTISVDIGTVVGGRKPEYQNGYVLVFHNTYVKRPGRKAVALRSGDHTGWIRVKQLPGDARRSLATYQRRVRHQLHHGKGSGHVAPVKGHTKKFKIQNPQSINDDDHVFRILGGGGSTPLGNYTHRPDRYGDVIIGVWNPPGSGANGQRFGGSGGIRAFLPLDQHFHLTEVGALTIHDKTGAGTSTWRYIAAKVNHETIYCWVLESWRSPWGDGQNF